MTQKQYYILILILVIHIVVCIIGTRRLIKSIILTKQQKKINLLFLWFVPFLWFAFINAMHKRTPGSHEISKKDDVSNNPFHESGEGAPGANIGF